MKNKTNKESGIPTPEDLGIPSGSFDPIKTIGMEGDFYRGLAKSNKSRPLIIKLGAILFGLLFFIIPALFMIFVGYIDIWNFEVILYPVLYLLVGVIIVWDNLRR